MQSAQVRIVDALATNLPPTQVFDPLRQVLQNYITSPNPNLRRRGMLALGISVEGRSGFTIPPMNGV